MRFSCKSCQATFQTATGAPAAATFRCPSCNGEMAVAAEVVELWQDRIPTRRYDLDDLRARLDLEREEVARTRATPRSPDQVWFAAVQGRQVGPLSAAGIAGLRTRGQLSAASLVWREGWPSWVAAEAVPELRAILGLPEEQLGRPFPVQPAQPAPPPFAHTYAAARAQLTEDTVPDSPLVLSEKTDPAGHLPEGLEAEFRDADRSVVTEAPAAPERDVAVDAPAAESSAAVDAPVADASFSAAPPDSPAQPPADETRAPEPSTAPAAKAVTAEAIAPEPAPGAAARVSPPDPDRTDPGTPNTLASAAGSTATPGPIPPIEAAPADSVQIAAASEAPAAVSANPNAEVDASTGESASASAREPASESHASHAPPALPFSDVSALEQVGSAVLAQAHGPDAESASDGKASTPAAHEVTPPAPASAAAPIASDPPTPPEPVDPSLQMIDLSAQPAVTDELPARRTRRAPSQQQWFSGIEEKSEPALPPRMLMLGAFLAISCLALWLLLHSR